MRDRGLLGNVPRPDGRGFLVSFIVQTWQQTRAKTPRQQTLHVGMDSMTFVVRGKVHRRMDFFVHWLLSPKLERCPLLHVLNNVLVQKSLKEQKTKNM